MSQLIKKIFGYICIVLTWCVNQGQKLMCRRESHKLYTIPKGKTPQEKDYYREYKSNLRKYGFHPVKRDFLVFKNYFIERGKNPSVIIPGYIINNYLTPLLNPIPYREYFEDKNMFDKIFPKEYMPKTLYRRMGNQWMDNDYSILSLEKVWEGMTDNNDFLKIIIKPTKNSSSGKGIELFEFHDSCWQNMKTGRKLEKTYLKDLYGGEDLIIQEVLKQNDSISQFCDTAVNTFRIVIYHSPIDGECHYIWGCLRVANKGALVDNTHAGGILFGINKEGTLDSYGFDQYGKKYSNFNGIDFSKQQFRIQQYPDLIEFCKKMSPFLLPNRFISFDIALDYKGDPKIIEYNIRGYSYWAGQFIGTSPLGEKNDEILEYITKNHSRALKFYYSIS